MCESRIGHDADNDLIRKSHVNAHFTACQVGREFGSLRSQTKSFLRLLQVSLLSRISLPLSSSSNRYRDLFLIHASLPCFLRCQEDFDLSHKSIKFRNLHCDTEPTKHPLSSSLETKAFFSSEHYDCYGDMSVTCWSSSLLGQSSSCSKLMGYLFSNQKHNQEILTT